MGHIRLVCLPGLVLLALLLVGCGGSGVALPLAEADTPTAQSDATLLPDASPEPTAQTGLLASLPDEPHPDLTPLEVVRIQVEALRNNDVPTPDSGIRKAFQFASPSNRETTGPLNQFIELVNNPQYRALLNARSVEYGPTDLDEATAVQPVIIESTDGSLVVYVFALSLQTEAPYEDCWMTDAVIRVDSREPEGQEI